MQLVKDNLSKSRRTGTPLPLAKIKKTFPGSNEVLPLNSSTTDSAFSASRTACMQPAETFFSTQRRDKLIVISSFGIIKVISTKIAAPRVTAEIGARKGTSFTPTTRSIGHSVSATKLPNYKIHRKLIGIRAFESLMPGEAHPPTRTDSFALQAHE